VQQQRAANLPNTAADVEMLTNAAAHFAMAQKLNPDNIVAGINLRFNQSLHDRKIASVDLSTTTADQFGKYHDWNEVLNANGPFDEPSFCFKDGAILMQGRVLRQAVAPFERVRQLVTNNLPARLWLAQAYLANRLPDRALDALREPLDHPQEFSVDATNSIQLNLLAAAAYFQKDDNARGIQLVEIEISRHPTNDALLVIAAQVYVERGLFTNALTIIDRKLKTAPDDPTWLFGKGYASIQLKAYDDAIAAFTRILAVQTNNYDALLNRAVACLQSGKLDDARADYEKLRAANTYSTPATYGLGEIAWRKHDTNEAIKNYETYLVAANTNTAEAKGIIQRLQELQGAPH
jgi:tetratricopeptide (TPR) repeat protein